MSRSGLVYHLSTYTVPQQEYNHNLYRFPGATALLISKASTLHKSSLLTFSLPILPLLVARSNHVIRFVALTFFVLEMSADR